MRGVRRIRRVIAAGLLALYLPACTSWKTSRVSPQQELTTRSPAAIRVVTTSGARYLVLQPVLAGDSIRGLVTQAGAWSYDTTTVQAIALADVTRMEVQRVNAAGTAAGTLLLLVAIGAMATIVVCTAGDCFEW